ncbi:methionine aminotransferase [Wenyingzhuangia sp. IMCC45533]
MNIKSKLTHLPESIFTTMSDLANKHQAINLSQSFPNFETSKKLKDLVNKAMLQGHNQYAHMRGDLELKEVIAQKIYKSYEAAYDANNEITITAGATEALFNAITAFVHKGDEVIIFRPAFDSYEPVVKLNGGIPVDVQLHYPDYQINWQEVASKITSKTKMIILNSPLNPTGTLMSKEDMLALEKIVSGTDIVVLSDEVYEHMTYDGLIHESSCKYSTLKNHSFIIASFGKTFHNTGWKMGYAVANKSLMDEFVKVHEFNVYSINTPFQKAFATFIKDEKNYTYLNQFYQNKRDLFLNGIKNSKFTFTPSKGTYFQLLKYDHITDENDVDFARRLVTQFNIAAIPVSVFNTHNLDEKVLRFCFAKTDETLIKASEILCKIH